MSGHIFKADKKIPYFNFFAEASRHVVSQQALDENISYRYVPQHIPDVLYGTIEQSFRLLQLDVLQKVRWNPHTDEPGNTKVQVDITLRRYEKSDEQGNKFMSAMLTQKQLVKFLAFWEITQGYVDNF